MEEEDKSEVEVEVETDKECEEAAEIQGTDAEATAAEGGGAVGEEKEVERDLLDLEGGHELLREEAAER